MPAYRVRTVFSGVAGVPWISNWYFDSSIVGSQTEAVDATAAAWGALDATMKSTVQWQTEAEVYLFSNPETLAGITTATPETGAGAQTGDVLPLQTQGLITWSTNTIFNNRRVSGRTFVPAPAETYNEAAGTPSVTYQGILSGIGGALIAAGLVIPSRASNTFVPVVASAAATKWSVLRSRRD